MEVNWLNHKEEDENKSLDAKAIIHTWANVLYKNSHRSRSDKKKKEGTAHLRDENMISTMKPLLGDLKLTAKTKQMMINMKSERKLSDVECLTHILTDELLGEGEEPNQYIRNMAEATLSNEKERNKADDEWWKRP